MSIKPGIAVSFPTRSAWFTYLKDSGYAVEQGVFASESAHSAYTLFLDRASEKLVLLAHGTGNDNLFTFQPLIESLLSKGFSVLSLDLPGHGRESSTLLTEESFARAGEDLKAYLQEKKLESRKLFAVGYSLGGVFCLQLARSQCLSFEKIALLAVPLRAKLGWKFFLTELLSLCSSSFYRQWRRYGWQEAVPAFGNFRRKDFPLRLSPGETLSYPAFVDKLLSRYSPLDLIRSSSQNYLLVLGSRDQLANPREAVRWREANPQLKVVTVDRSNHFLLPFEKPTIDALTQWMTL